MKMAKCDHCPRYKQGISCCSNCSGNNNMKMTKEEQTKQLQEVQQQLKEAQEKLKQIENTEVKDTYTLVPSTINLSSTLIRYGIIHCNKRLYINKGLGIDNLIICKTQFKILHTPVTKLENGRIYFCTECDMSKNQSISKIQHYSIYSNEDKGLYSWRSNINNSISFVDTGYWTRYYPVIPVEK